MIQSQFTKFKPFNTEKNRLVRFQCDEQIEEQPDSPWLSLPGEISCAILYQCPLESYCNVKRVCKQLNKLADRRIEYYAYENTLKGCTSQESNDVLVWWYNTLKLRAYSFNEPTLLTEYFDDDVTPKDIIEFCRIENPRDRYLGQYIKPKISFKRPHQELESIIAFDADAILQYLIEIFEEEFKDDEQGEWRLMMEPKFHNFLWCLVVAFEDHLDPSTEAGKKFSTMKVWPVFMNIMSKYSPAVVRLFIDDNLLKMDFPHLTTTPYKVFRGLAAYKEKYPLDLTSTLTDISVSDSFGLSPLLLCCHVNNHTMFDELAKHTPFVPSDGYFATLALRESRARSGEQFYIFDALVKENIDINAKMPTNLKSPSHSWIETVLGVAFFEYQSNDRTSVIEWLVYHGARFSENELQMLTGSDSQFSKMVQPVLEICQLGKKRNLFKETIEWNPKQSEEYHQVCELVYLSFLEADNFSVQHVFTHSTYFGNWKRGNKSNHIICTANKQPVQYLRGSYEDNIDGGTIVDASKIYEFFAYKAFDGRLVLLQEDASDLTPSMELLDKSWVQKNYEIPE